MDRCTGCSSNAQKNVDIFAQGTNNPWEDILDKSSSEGSSLRMPYTDKALKAEKKSVPQSYGKGDPQDQMEGE